MGTRYPGRPSTSNRTKMVSVRLEEYQASKVEEYSDKFKMSTSEIVREAIAIWLNMNGSKGVE
jgi:Arc/MetJ-type ribon-helix-helix transcriptional regulator